MKNKTYYKFMLEEQAWTKINQLKQDIFQWTVNSRGNIDDKIVENMRASMDEAMENPFAYFYVMPKIHKPGPMSSKPGVSLQSVVAYHIH